LGASSFISGALLVSSRAGLKDKRKISWPREVPREKFKPKRYIKNVYPEETGISFFLFFLTGPEPGTFRCLEGGSMLRPASDAGVFQTQEAGGSPS
jgi:hypothetical protein